MKIRLMHLNAKKILQFAALSILLTLTQTVKAYDEDTHFYMTYAMARYTGIKHEVAAEMALAAQWMDESLASSPLEVSDPKQYIVRYLFHFPGSKLSATADDPLCSSSNFFIDALKNFEIDPINGRLNGHDLNTITVKNHPLASEMIREGFEKGHFDLAAAGLHVLEDSFSHAGHNALFGHAVEGHHADRPFLFWDKYKEMIRTVFKATVAFRRLLPAQFIEQTPNAKLDAATLADRFIVELETKSKYNQNYFANPTYAKAAIRYIIDQALSEKLIYPLLPQQDLQQNAEYLLNKANYQEGKEPEDLAKDIVKFILEEEKKNATFQNGDKLKFKYFNIDKLLKSIGGDSLNDPNQNVINSFEDGELIEIVLNQIMKGNVPRRFNSEHKIEFEIEGPIREKEMSLRINEVKQFIYRLFNVKLQLIGRTSSIQNQDPEIFYVSKGPQEQKAWDKMIMNFMYPTSQDSFLGIGMIQESFCTHIIPHGNNKTYQYPVLMEKEIKSGNFKSIINSDPAKNILVNRWTYKQSLKMNKNKNQGTLP